MIILEQCILVINNLTVFHVKDVMQHLQKCIICGYTYKRSMQTTIRKRIQLLNVKNAVKYLQEEKNLNTTRRIVTLDSKKVILKNVFTSEEDTVSKEAIADLRMESKELLHLNAEMEFTADFSGVVYAAFSTQG